MTPVPSQFDGYFARWLRTLRDDGQPGQLTHDDAVGSTVGSNGVQQPGPVRYGEWQGPGGRTLAVRMTHPEWVLNQIDVLHAFDDFITPEDVVVVAAPYELSFEGASIERAMEWMGAALISVGTSSTICPVPRLLNLIHRYQVTILACPPQLAADLAALDEAAGRNPGASTITTVIGTRPTAPERLRRIAAKWGASATEIFSTPTRPATATRCEFGQLHLLEDRVKAYLRSATPGRIAADGTRGELMLAIRHPESSTKVPLPTGELVEFHPPGTSCGCGSTGQVVIPLGQVADALTTPEGLVTQVDVEHCLFESQHPQGRVTSSLEGGQLAVACAVRSSTHGHHQELRERQELKELVRSRFGPAVELTLFDDAIAEVNPGTRSSR